MRKYKSTYFNGLFGNKKKFLGINDHVVYDGSRWDILPAVKLVPLTFRKESSVMTVLNGYKGD
jgi:hypothetical protein